MSNLITWPLKEHRGNKLSNNLRHQVVQPDTYAQVTTYAATQPGTT
jgi:hypothetical protein